MDSAIRMFCTVPYAFTFTKSEDPQLGYLLQLHMNTGEDSYLWEKSIYIASDPRKVE